MDVHLPCRQGYMASPMDFFSFLFFSIKSLLGKKGHFYHQQVKVKTNYLFFFFHFTSNQMFSFSWSEMTRVHSSLINCLIPPPLRMLKPMSIQQNVCEADIKETRISSNCHLEQSSDLIAHQTFAVLTSVSNSFHQDCFNFCRFGRYVHAHISGRLPGAI